MNSDIVDSCRCPKDYVSHSTFGFVLDTEMVARIVSSSHIGKNGVKASVIPNAHLRESGLSLFRMGYLAKAQFDSLAFAISASIPPGTSTTVGVILASASELRGFLDESGRPSICLFDEPTIGAGDFPENPAHAVAIAAEEYADDEIIKIKTELLAGVFGQLIPLNKLAHPVADGLQ